MYKNIVSRENYKFKKKLKYLIPSKVSRQEEKIKEALDKEVKHTGYNTEVKLLKSGTNDRKPQLPADPKLR